MSVARHQANRQPRRPLPRRLAALSAATLLGFVLATLLAAAAIAEFEPDPGREKVIASLSQNSVGITADFTGSSIFVYGAVERDRLSDVRDDEIDVVIAITGPNQRVVIRKKARKFGIWVNSDSVEIDAAPSFYAVATTKPFEEILSETSDLRHKITINRAIRLVGEAQNVADPTEFAEAIIRLRRNAGIYYEEIGAVSIIARTLFQTTIDLPANIVEGDYEAKVFLLRDRRVVDDFSTRIEVRKVGLERWIYNLAYDRSLLYGMLSILVGFIAGWGASEIFRQLRR